MTKDKRRHKDPAAAEWRRGDKAAWDKAVELSPEAPMDAYNPHPLPAFKATKHVKRELYGRYIEDRDTGLVHDTEHAVEACDIDGIKNGTFYHFEDEVPDGLTDHATCMAEEVA